MSKANLLHEYKTASTGSIHQSRFHQQLDRIEVPTLIIWGKQDSILPVSLADVAATKIPYSRLHIFEKCGHWAQVEYPEKFNQLVLEFLA
jgi:pimeloyl-ACP methyl ester carboxylesterase